MSDNTDDREGQLAAHLQDRADAAAVYDAIAALSVGARCELLEMLRVAPWCGECGVGGRECRCWDDE